MRIEYPGEAILRRRKHLRLPQNLVCEGLCTIMTLSRFENGKQTPSRDCVVAMLERLGLPSDRYNAQLTREETQLTLLRKEVGAYFSQYEQTLGEEQQQARMNTLEKLSELERLIKENDHINQQFVLRIKTSLGEYSPQEQLEMIMEALRLTSPRFNLDELSSCLYCKEEIVLIHNIAIRHSRCGQRKKAIDIYRQLLALIQKRTPSLNKLPLIMYNYARYLGCEGRLEEAMEISAQGRQICIRQENYCMLPGFLHIDAECCYRMGEFSKSVELYRSAYYIYGAIMNKKDQEVLKTKAKERFNLIF